MTIIICLACLNSSFITYQVEVITEPVAVRTKWDGLSKAHDTALHRIYLYVLAADSKSKMNYNHKQNTEAAQGLFREGQW